MIDKKIIAERKAMYGDNFADIANAWQVSEADVCHMMADMKQCRIDAIDKKLSEFPLPDVGIALHKAREDSVIDKANYEWIANNYDEYKTL